MIQPADLVRVLALPPEAHPIPGIERAPAAEIVNRVWRVSSTYQGRIFLDYREGEPPRRMFVGQSCPSFESHQLEVVGKAPVTLCPHLQPILAALLNEGAVVTAYGDPWPARRWGAAIDRTPTDEINTLIAAWLKPEDRWMENDPHFGGPIGGVSCRSCGDAITWPE